LLAEGIMPQLKTEVYQLYLLYVPTAVMSKLKLFIPIMLPLTVRVSVTGTVAPALIF